MKIFNRGKPPNNNEGKPPQQKSKRITMRILDVLDLIANLAGAGLLEVLSLDLSDKHLSAITFLLITGCWLYRRYEAARDN